ncbi:MAG TPA: hypothetical protein ENN67_08115, partial [Firmicutes bacterium]|nr:hypothetical protein [Bacillota bacterium]
SYGNGSDEEPHYDRSNPAGQWLYFQSNRAGGSNYEIYGIDPTEPEGFGNAPYRYTYNTAFDGYPASYPAAPGIISWTSDRHGNMEIMLLTGTAVKRLTNNSATDAHSSFSPDGKWIAFMSDRASNQFDIYRMDYEGGNLMRITFDDAPDLWPVYGDLP